MEHKYSQMLNSGRNVQSMIVTSASILTDLIVPFKPSCISYQERYFSTFLPLIAADNLSPQLDKLATSQLGSLAQRRLARGVRLNHAEATVCSARQPMLLFPYLIS